MNDGVKKILIIVVLLAAIGAVIAAKQFNAKPKVQTEPASEVTNVINDEVVAEVTPKNDAMKATVVTITEKVLAEPSLPRLLELGSVTCIPCKMMKPILDALEVEYKGSMMVDFIDVWADESAGKKYAISSIPTQIFFAADGKEIFRHEGFFAKEAILAKWKELGVDLTEAK